MILFPIVLGFLVFNLVFAAIVVKDSSKDKSKENKEGGDVH